MHRLAVFPFFVLSRLLRIYESSSSIANPNAVANYSWQLLALSAYPTAMSCVILCKVAVNVEYVPIDHVSNSSIIGAETVSTERWGGI
jgi:hypothetical protein